MARVLVVEDEAMLRTLIRQVLEEHAYIVTEAENGEEALAMLGVFAFDLVITDIFMPVRDGIETIRTVRRCWPQVKLLAMSGWQSNYLLAARDFGTHSVLAKPFGERDLLRAVETLLLESPPQPYDNGDYPT